MEITKEMLNKMEACHDGMRWFLKHFPEGKADFKSLIYKLHEYGDKDDLDWLYDNLLMFDGVDIKSYIDDTVSIVIDMARLEIEEEDEDTKCTLIGSSKTLDKISNGSDGCQIGSIGGRTKIGNAGCFARIGSMGQVSLIGNSGEFSQIASSGNYTRISNSGSNVEMASVGDYDRIGNSGEYAKIISSGESARIGNVGCYAQIEAKGKNSIIAIIDDGRFKAGEGGAVSVAYFDGERTRFAVGYVGENIEADTWYTVNQNGDFIRYIEYKTEIHANDD